MKLPCQSIKKIAVFRALQLGDMLNVIPAIRSLRMAYPKAEIALVGLPWAASFTERFHCYFDRFIHFPGFPGLPEQPFTEALYELFLQQMIAEQFDFVLQMQGNGTIVNDMILKWRAKHTAGFHNRQSLVDSNLFLEYPDYGSEIYRHLLLMQHLGIPLRDDDLEFPVTGKDEEEWQDLKQQLSLKNYVCVHPGSRGEWRQWPPKYFARLADVCVEKGLIVVVTGVPQEADVTKKVMKEMTCDAIDATGKTSLGSLALLIKHARCLIANCTGVSHIASATKTPSVIISMDGEPQRWSPLDSKLHSVTDWTKEPDFSIPHGHLLSLLA